MRTVVTGGAGHLGEALIRTFADAGHEVVGLDVLRSPSTDMMGSITDRSFVRAALKNADAVVHAATLHKPHVRSQPRQAFVDSNVTRRDGPDGIVRTAAADSTVERHDRPQVAPGALIRTHDEFLSQGAGPGRAAGPDLRPGCRSRARKDGRVPADPVPLDPVPLDPVPLDPVPLDPVPINPDPIDPDHLRALLASAVVFALPMVERFRGITVREGVLLHGPAGWAEFAPFRDYDDRQCVPWLRAAIESATVPWPDPVRTVVEVNTTVPVVDPDRAAALVRASGCRTAKVKVADPRVDLAADLERVAAVREALGPTGRIRIDANAAWTVPAAVRAIEALDAAAGSLEYAEQPCRTLPELAEVRRRVQIRIAADESIRHATDPGKVALAGAADVAIVKVAPLGGVRAALRVARGAGLPVVVSSAVDSSVGLAAGLALAAALPDLPYACGLGTADLLAVDVTSAPLSPVGGILAVRRTSPDPDRLAAVAAEPTVTAYWLARLSRVAALLGTAADG